jgi:hypothetical protein
MTLEIGRPTGPFGARTIWHAAVDGARSRAARDALALETAGRRHGAVRAARAFHAPEGLGADEELTAVIDPVRAAKRARSTRRAAAVRPRIGPRVGDRRDRAVDLAGLAARAVDVILSGHAEAGSVRATGEKNRENATKSKKQARTTRCHAAQIARRVPRRLDERLVLSGTPSLLRPRRSRCCCPTTGPSGRRSAWTTRATRGRRSGSTTSCSC